MPNKKEVSKMPKEVFVGSLDGELYVYETFEDAINDGFGFMFIGKYSLSDVGEMGYVFKKGA